MRLTLREQQVIRLLVLGATDKEIARELGIEPVTVRTHIGSLRQKLGALNRAQMAARAVALGLVSAVGEADLHNTNDC